jgi:outer membrane protein OmpA-like peptidoglycan-associated protein
LLLGACACGLVLLSGCERTESVQWGFRGNSMIQLYKTGRIYDAVQLNQIPPPEPSDPYDPDIPMATEVNENVQVLTDLNALEFARLMQALSTWVAPVQGCEYCHNTENLASDEKYTKIVSRSMLQMTRDINTNWKSHVANTGVTCWTCHRGQNVPSDIWFTAPEPKTPSAGISGNKAGQNTAGVKINGNSSLPFDPLTPFLEADNQIGVQGMTVLPSGNRRSIKQTEWTYALMMYMSNSLGVNCTYCHQTRAMGRWEESTPQRVTAWHGIRMVRDINNNYLVPLKPLYPAERLGPTGDAPKTACATCHKGAFKPLFGVSMLGDYPSLAGVIPDRRKPVEEAPAEAEASAGAAEPQMVAMAVDGDTAADADTVTAADVDADSAPMAETEIGEEATAVDGSADAQTLISEQPEAAIADQEPAEQTESEQTEPEPAEQAGADPQAASESDMEPASGEPTAEVSGAPQQHAEAKPAAEVDVVGGPDDATGDATAESPMAAEDGVPETSSAPDLPAVEESRVAALESMITDLREQLATVMEGDVDAASAEVAPQALLGSPGEAGGLSSEIDRLRTALQSPDLQTAKHFALALNAAEQRLEAVEARLEHERATLQQRLSLALLERDEAKQQADASAARMLEEHAAAMSAADERVKAVEARLQQVQERLDALPDSSAAEGVSSGTDAKAAGDADAGSAAADGDAAPAVFVAGKHQAALDAAEQRIAALHARLGQERTALRQQLDVVRDQRDDAASDVEMRLSKAYQADLREAEQRIGALGARLEQERVALQQQLRVVRAQRDAVASEVESRLSRAHRAELDSARTRIGALQARLDQERTALQQQLDVVRAQRDADESVENSPASGAQMLLNNTDSGELEAARTRIGALQTRLDQERNALQQQLEVVRAQRDGVAADIEAQLQRQHAAALSAMEQRVSAARAKLDNQRTALEQQLALVRAQRDAAAEERDARPTRAAHEKALQQADLRVRAALARLDNERTALQQQLDVVRAQRDAAAEAEAASVARLNQDLEAERERLDELRSAQAAELEALRKQQEDAAQAAEEARARMQAMAADAERQLAEAEAVTNSVQTLFDSAAELGGEVTEDGVRVSLGGDQLRFASGSAALPAGELPTIDRTAALLVARPELTARIEGHTDSAGGADLNQTLSRQRAEAVMQALIDRGVDAGRLSAEGLGEANPIADNNTAQGRGQNRRVEVYLIGENLTGR